MPSSLSTKKSLRRSLGLSRSMSSRSERNSSFSSPHKRERALVRDWSSDAPARRTSGRSISGRSLGVGSDGVAPSVESADSSFNYRDDLNDEGEDDDGGVLPKDHEVTTYLGRKILLGPVDPETGRRHPVSGMQLPSPSVPSPDIPGRSSVSRRVKKFVGRSGSVGRADGAKEPSFSEAFPFKSSTANNAPSFSFKKGASARKVGGRTNKLSAAAREALIDDHDGNNEDTDRCTTPESKRSSRRRDDGNEPSSSPYRVRASPLSPQNGPQLLNPMTTDTGEEGRAMNIDVPFPRLLDNEAPNRDDDNRSLSSARLMHRLKAATDAAQTMRRESTRSLEDEDDDEDVTDDLSSAVSTSVVSEHSRAAGEFEEMARRMKEEVQWMAEDVDFVGLERAMRRGQERADAAGADGKENVEKLLVDRNEKTCQVRAPERILDDVLARARARLQRSQQNDCQAAGGGAIANGKANSDSSTKSPDSSSRRRSKGDNEITKSARSDILSMAESRRLRVQRQKDQQHRGTSTRAAVKSKSMESLLCGRGQGGEEERDKAKSVKPTARSRSANDAVSLSRAFRNAMETADSTDSSLSCSVKRLEEGGEKAKIAESARLAQARSVTNNKAVALSQTFQSNELPARRPPSLSVEGQIKMAGTPESSADERAADAVGSTKSIGGKRKDEKAAEVIESTRRNESRSSNDAVALSRAFRSSTSLGMEAQNSRSAPSEASSAAVCPQKLQSQKKVLRAAAVTAAGMALSFVLGGKHLLHLPPKSELFLSASAPSLSPRPAGTGDKIQAVQATRTPSSRDGTEKGEAFRTGSRRRALAHRRGDTDAALPFKQNMQPVTAAAGSFHESPSQHTSVAPRDCSCGTVAVDLRSKFRSHRMGALYAAGAPPHEALLASNGDGSSWTNVPFAGMGINDGY